MTGVLKAKMLDGTWVPVSGSGPEGPAGPEGPEGDPGPPGPEGDPGIVISDTPPVDTDVLWADTTVSGTGGGGIASVGPIDVLNIWAGTAAEYAAVGTPDPNTLYIVI